MFALLICGPFRGAIMTWFKFVARGGAPLRCATMPYFAVSQWGKVTHYDFLPFTVGS
jgi:hypothetical protein